MKKILLLGLLLPFAGFAQITVSYDFNDATSVASYSTNGESTTFLPAPSTNGGTARVRVGSGGGSFNLVNPGTPMGTFYELSGVAPTNGSVNKFSIQSYSPSKVFKTSFKVRFDGGSSGTWYFFQGSGNTFTQNTAFSSADVFTGLRFVFGASNTITTSRRDNSGWNGTAVGAISAQATEYLIEVYGNNSTASGSYTKNGAQTVAANTWDLWVNDILVGDDLPKSGVSNNTNIDAFTFYGENSTANVAMITLDDIAYSTVQPTTTLPISLTSFTAKPVDKTILLNWATASENNNQKFEVLRSADGKNFESITTVNGAGNSDMEKYYSLVDENPYSGTNYYQLLQTDFNGSTSTSNVISAKAKVEIMSISAYASGATVSVNVDSPNQTDGEMTLFDMGGRKLDTKSLILNKGYNEVIFNQSLKPGTYFINLISEGKSTNLKFIK